MTRRLLVAGGTALIVSIFLAIAFKPALYPPYDEAIDYVSIAHLNYGPVHSYYGARVLHPLVVRIVAEILRWPIDARTFWVVSAVSLIVLFLSLAAYYGVECVATPWLYTLLIATAAVVDAYRNYYWQDLFYAAVCAVFFLTLRINRWVSLPVLLMLYLTRESTILLVIVLVLFAVSRRQWAFCLAVLAVGLAGMKTTSLFVQHSIPNNHGVSMFVLDGLKLPFNFAFNVCGLELWTNTIAATTDPPTWVANVPHWLHLGNIRQIGYSGFSWLRPLRLLVLMSSAFGVLPVLAASAAALRKGWPLLRRFDYAIAFAYGLLTFFLAPLVGTTTSRYVLYAWPLFWISAVLVLNASIGDMRARCEFILLSLAASWVPACVRWIVGPKPVGAETLSAVSAGGMILSLVILVPIYVRSWFLVDHALSHGHSSIVTR